MHLQYIFDHGVIQTLPIAAGVDAHRAHKNRTDIYLVG